MGKWELASMCVSGHASLLPCMEEKEEEVCEEEDQGCLSTELALNTLLP